MSRRAIEIGLDGARVAVLGLAGAVPEAIVQALVENGGRPAERADEAEIVIFSYPLVPSEPIPADPAASIDGIAGAMQARGKGRILFILSALAALPARRFVDISVHSAAAYARMRMLAMAYAPQVLVNAVGVGTIGQGECVAGDASLLGHVPIGRAGALDEVVAAALFLCDPANTYTTGQLLSVDGGWTAGYARNF